MRWKVVVLCLGLLVSVAFTSEQDFDEGDDATVSIEPDTEETKSTGTEVTDDDIQNYESPTVEKGKYYFADHFDDANIFVKNWIQSQAKKDDTADEIAKYDGVWTNEMPIKQILKNDLGLVLKSKAKHAAISSRLAKPFVFDDKPLIVQYEVTMQDGQECGGSYIKLLSAGRESQDLTKFNDKTPYTIMFGPDKCGNDIKLHFIFRHVNPLNGTISEKHCRKPKERLEEPFKDKEPHLYQLELNPDNTFKIRVDHRVINEGSLLIDFNPTVNPSHEIDDPNDIKPENWDEREKIPDPDSKKPNNWDEDAPPQIPDPNVSKPEGWLDDEDEMIPDPTAKKPDDWDTEMDGDWEPPLIENPICEKVVGCGLWKAPLIPNPEYRGKWRAPLIDNPNYQGKWLPRKIPNPDFFEDLNPFRMTTIDAVGIELWSMSSNILFDNLIITDDIEIANEWATKTYDLKRRHIDKTADSFLTRIVKVTNDNPILWGVYIFVVGVPLTYIIYAYCCSKDKSPKSSDMKKTDEIAPDDDEQSNTAEQEEPISEDIGAGDSKNSKQNASQKNKKSDLDVDKIGDNNDKLHDDNEEQEIEDVTTVDNEEESEDISPQPTQESSAEGARRRVKSRKE